jgi:U6 snRNA phosphodiesterase
MVEGMSPTLQSFRQKDYYSDPKFHASIAWALLTQSKPEVAAAQTPKIDSPSLDLLSSETTQFPTIRCIPEELAPRLNEEFIAELQSKSVGVCDVRKVNVKIGKEVSSWALGS